MGKTTIEWADYSFNPWWGCVEVSPACDHCYARTFATRLGFDIWGKDAPRRFFGDAHWDEPRKWNRLAKPSGIRPRVFCASMADVLERRTDLVAPRARLWALIEECDQLDWLLLTKRPGNFRTMVPKRWMTEGGWPAHVWPGTTVENRQQLLLRAPVLCKVPSLHKFLSIEPLLEDLVPTNGDDDFGMFLVTGWTEPPYLDHITWVIAGGESGNQARPPHPEWFRRIRDACERYGTPFLFKQWGEWTPGENVERTSGTIQTATWVNDAWTMARENLANADGHVDDEPDLYRVGKAAAGRLLDGVEWNGVPAPRAWPTEPWEASA